MNISLQDDLPVHNGNVALDYSSLSFRRITAHSSPRRQFATTALLYRRHSQHQYILPKSCCAVLGAVDKKGYIWSYGEQDEVSTKTLIKPRVTANSLVLGSASLVHVARHGHKVGAPEHYSAKTFPYRGPTATIVTAVENTSQLAIPRRDWIH